MERKDINQFNMLNATGTVLDKNRVIYSANTTMSTYVDQFLAMNTQIAGLDHAYAEETAGGNTTKEQAETNVITSALIVAGGLLAHASTINDAKIKEIASVTEYSLRRLRDNDLSTSAHLILNAAKTKLADLTVWGVTETIVDKLESDVDTFDKSIPSGTASKSESKQTRTELKAKIKEAKALLKDHLDPMMLPFKTINPTFYGQYENARQVIDTAASHPGEDSENTDNK